MFKGKTLRVFITWIRLRITLMGLNKYINSTWARRDYEYNNLHNGNGQVLTKQLSKEIR